MEDCYVWAMFYAGVVSIKAHPRNTQPVDLDQCAEIADGMMQRYIQRFPEVSKQEVH